MLQKITVFQFDAHLSNGDGSTFWFPFLISARSFNRAETLLEKYLTENKKDTGLIYESVVGMRGLESKNIVVDLLDGNQVIIDDEQIVNEKQKETNPQILKIAGVLKDVIGDKVFFNHKHPVGSEVLKAFLNDSKFEFDIKFCDSDFEQTKESNGVDGDGFPWIRKIIRIVPYNIFVNLLIYHHCDKWDFYIEEVKY